MSEDATSSQQNWLMSRNMAEEKSELSSKEDEKVIVPEKEETPKSEEASPKEDFVKENESVSAGKHNQAIRKLREAELANRELEKQLAEAKAQPEKEEEEKEEEDFFKDEESKVDPAKLIDEKLKPVIDSIKKREEDDRKIQRDAFFDANPKYQDPELLRQLMDVMDDVINPHSKEPYYKQLHMAHSILSGDTYDAEVETKKKEIAGDAAASGDGAEKGSVKEEFTAEDRKHQKEFNISDEGMRAYKDKIRTGSLRILS